MAKNRFANPDEKRLARVFSDKLRGVLAERKASSPVVDAEAVRRAVLDQYIDVTKESMLTSNGLGAQLLDEKLYVPKWGCDTLDHMLAALLSPTQEAKP